MKVRLTKLLSTHSNLRTDVIEGRCDSLPKEGRDFFMTAPPLDPKAVVREIHTTKVKKVKWDIMKSAIFVTKNSTYQIDVLDE